ncbi:MAG: DUF4965 domain-containing protein [Bacteroidales bacterium]|nr:DUF4965 domain-containing protein [Bacteroidales bacterium]
MSAGCTRNEIERNTLRAPAYPLVTIDPFTSAWSMDDKLFESPVKHWTGAEFPLIGVLKVDGEVYRFLGKEEIEYTRVVPMAAEGGWTGEYTFTRPQGKWYEEGYKAAGWKKGPGAFGTKNYLSSGTVWDTEDIWVRREFDIEENLEGKKVFLSYSNDDIAVIYVNGTEILNTGANCHTAARLELPAGLLRRGRNLIAATCKDTGGLAYLDFGITKQVDSKPVLEKTAVQNYADVQATSTIYGFTCGPVDLELTFTAPLLLEDLDLVSRPVNYISYSAKANDGRKHDVEIYFEASPKWSINTPGQPTESEIIEKDGMTYLKAGSKSQAILSHSGDDDRIDWGYFYLCTPEGNTGIGTGADLREAFVSGEAFTGKAGADLAGRMAIARRVNLGKEDHILIGYDDICSIQYFGENLRPYWNRNADKSIFDMFNEAEADYKALSARCRKFDREMFAEAKAAGGQKYAELCALAYRQAIHAHKLVQSPDGDILWLSKENNSNGSIGTVDVTYPSAPLFLRYNPELAKGLMNHIYYYTESGRWTKPFPAHDVGTYPLANGQTYGGDMPVEEAGNMLILTAAVCKYEGSADYARKHWETLTAWTDYLRSFGLDPENQLCTDDFAGHFAHNTNLSVKAILGIASYGYLANLLRKPEIAAEYTQAAREMAQKWVEMADDGDHYRLTFDKPGTWSQKYNLVWDRLLGLNIFDKNVAEKETAWYLTSQNEYGLPLDNRETYTKTDWIIWTATLASDRASFEALVAPVWKFMDETVDRVPMSDWVFTDKPNYRGFKARSVVGGYYIKLLENK